MLTKFEYLHIFLIKIQNIRGRGVEENFSVYTKKDFSKIKILRRFSNKGKMIQFTNIQFTLILQVDAEQ